MNATYIPKESLVWFKNKNLKPSFDHLDIFREEHANAFTVAKAMKLDVLSDIHSAIQTALAEGKTFQQFQKELKPILSNKGWWGVKEMTDPHTKRRKLVQLGSPRRLKVIYQTNMRTARAAGQWQRIQRTVKTHPFLLYGLGPSERHREEHQSWAGKIIRADDPWWLSHFPPNGWGCKCRVRQISKREAERKGGAVKAPEITTREWVNKRTGEVTQVPKGIDPGWDYNFGHSQKRLTDVLSNKLETAEPEVAQKAIEDLVKGEAFDQWRAKPTGDYPIGRIPEAFKRPLNADKTIVKLSEEAAITHQKQSTPLTTLEHQALPAAMQHGRIVQVDNQYHVYYQYNSKLIKATIVLKDDGQPLVSVYSTATQHSMRKDLKLGTLIKDWEI